MLRGQRPKEVALSTCRDHILNIKEAPAPKPVGKGAKRTLEQATAAPAAAAPSASAQPPQEGSTDAQQAAAPSAEGEQATEGQETTGPLAAPEQTLQDATQQQQPEEASGQAASSEVQADGDAARSTVTVTARQLPDVWHVELIESACDDYTVCLHCAWTLSACHVLASTVLDRPSKCNVAVTVILTQASHPWPGFLPIKHLMVTKNWVRKRWMQS